MNCCTIPFSEHQRFFTKLSFTTMFTVLCLFSYIYKLQVGRRFKTYFSLKQNKQKTKPNPKPLTVIILNLVHLLLLCPLTFLLHKVTQIFFKECIFVYST